jgi:pimeloyl-ACP methyl ester carboxylesterase
MAVSLDPVALGVVDGTWSMPVLNQEITLDDGRKRRWQAVQVEGDGVFKLAGRGGYLALGIDSPDDRVAVLEASGHSLVYVAGVPRTGDPYAHGYVRLPLKLGRGRNALLFQADRRGQVTVRLRAPRAEAELNADDITAPDFVTGQPVDTEAALVVMNNSEEENRGLAIISRVPGGPETRTDLPPLGPLSVRKLPFRLRGTAPGKGSEVPVDLELVRGHGSSSETLDTAALKIRVREAFEAQKRTFHSTIDGSLQYFALLPARPVPGGGGGGKPSAAPPGLVLTLHGASVEAIGQAQAYASKPDLHLVAPTNRRPYGFDWEDWGRLDALEVLDLAQRSLAADPRRTYLTGHSMGGHGTWHVGVTFPDRFATVAPSAGWISMWSYAGARRADQADRLEALATRATNPSDTLGLVRNLAGCGVYVLHGDADDNVPVDQARRMREVLGTFHPDFAYHEQPGAGHWWGSPCVDWPPLFAFMKEHRLAEPREVRRVDFTTMNPGVSATAHWATIEAQQKFLQPSSIHLRLDPDRRRFSGQTENVARLAFDVGNALADSSRPIEVELDGQALKDVTPASADGSKRVWLVRQGTTWSTTPRPSRSLKGPHRAGPFKEAFQNRFVLVYGTRGTAEENAWSRARARFDAEVFWYRGNGSVDVVSDVEFLEPAREVEFRLRNVILYGHVESHAAWASLLGESPVQVHRGKITLGAREIAGDDLACLFLRPRPGSDRASVGVVSGTGMTGLRLTGRLPYFVSGVAYPDCAVYRLGRVKEGKSALCAAGFFGNDWSVDAGEFAWSE